MAYHFAEGGFTKSTDKAAPNSGESEQDMLRRHATELAGAGYKAPRPSEEEYMAGHFARGGEIEMPDDEVEDEHDSSMAAAIMAKRRRKNYADGGMVDLEANSEESPNNEDQMSFEANGKEQ